MSDSSSKVTQRVVAWVWEKLEPYHIEVLEGCPNCGLSLVTKPDYGPMCPFCGWGPETEPEKSGEEARAEFLREVVERHVKKR